MNFFARRKFLKKANTLDLTPLRLLDHEIREDAKVYILLPRFKGTFLGPFSRPQPTKFIPIRLDEFGTATWLAIDGKHTVQQIGDELRSAFPEKLDGAPDLDDRLSKFIFLLYDQDYITFRELQDKPGPGT